jgi:delta 1-pyrroline-5-carboxylate dehydrogenase
MRCNRLLEGLLNIKVSEGRLFFLVVVGLDVVADACGVGQKCSALSRLYVANSIWPQFKAQLLEETAKIKVGPSEQWDSFMGPVM